MKKKIIALTLGFVCTLVIFELTLILIGALENSKSSNTPSKDSDTFTILTLGNSYTAGAGAPKGKSYPDQLNKFLKERKTKKYNVINHGRGNVTSTYIVERLPYWLKDNPPNMVFVMTGEPNYWNKYGFNNFLETQNQEIPLFSRIVDFFRWSKTYRFFELLSQKEEQATLFKENSNRFYNFGFIQGSTDNVLAYKWLGQIYYYLTRFNELGTSEGIEVKRILGGLSREQGNSMASWALAREALNDRNDLSDFYYYANKTVDQWPYFNYAVWKALEELNDKNKKKYSYEYNELLKKLLAKERPESLELIKKWNSSFEPEKFVNQSEPEKLSKFIYNMFLTNPHDVTSVHKLYERSPDSKYLADLLLSLMEICPIHPLVDYIRMIQAVKEHHPELAGKIDERILALNNHLGNKEIFDSVNYDDVDRWITSDLDKIVKIIQAAGAKIVIQTYPPPRASYPRREDEVIKKFMLKKKTKDVVLMDVGLMLRKSFDKKNGGDRFYSNELGNTDNHQNATGNYIIAKLMLDYIE